MGCLPTKTLVRSARLLNELRYAAGGVEVDRAVQVGCVLCMREERPAA